MMVKHQEISVEITYNANQPYILNYPYRTLIIGSSGSDKINALLDLIKHQRPDIDKIYLCVKDRVESKYQLLINKREKVEIEKIKIPKAFIDYS